MVIPKGLINRDRYLTQVSPFIEKNLIKVFTGQRRVGKSYLMYQIMESILENDTKASIIYINCEDMQFSHLKNAQQLHDYILSMRVEEKMNYVFIDEVQDVEGFESALRSLLLRTNFDLYITGSNAKMLSGELATYLGGRYIEFPVYSLSYPEFLTFHKRADTMESYMLFVKYGGLPYLANLELEDDIVWDYLSSIYSTILLKDVITRNKLRNIVFFERLVRFLSDNIGSLFSARKISEYLKSQQISLTSMQIQHYVGYLCDAFLIHRIQKFDIVGKRLFDFGEKLYFENLGLRNVIVGYRTTDRAKLLENAVFNHLLYLGYHVNVGSFHVYEVDFVAERNGERIYLQVTQRIDDEKTFDREFGNLLKIQDNYPKWIVTEDDFSGNSIEGIKTMSVRKFLMLQEL